MTGASSGFGVRVAVAPDLHYDREGNLTPPDVLAALREELEAAGVDAVVLAGDLGHPFEELLACLEVFSGLTVPVGVVAGNHDVWRDDRRGLESADLLRRHLPDAVREAGMVWLEADDLRIGAVAVVGSLAWYDYSAAPAHLPHDAAWYARMKGQCNADAWRVDWPWDDVAVAASLRAGLVRRLERLEADPGVERVVVVTHVPLFECQMTRRPGDEYWERTNAYFGNLETGRAVARFGKVAAVASGHTHQAEAGEVERGGGLAPIRAVTVGSDYGEPRFEVLELSRGGDDAPGSFGPNTRSAP